MRVPSIRIASRRLSAEDPPYIIAELSANHNGKLENALNMIDAAKRAGADAVKLQTYTPETITLDCERDEFRIDGGLWDGRTLHELYKEAHLPWEWHESLFKYARKLDITIFSSPFDPTAADLLDDLGAPAFKIASFEAVDLPLIRYVAGKGKPMIISTGMADDEEIEEAAQAARDGGCTDFVLLHCVSSYPAPASDYNLATIPDMARRWGVPVGLSDHTLDNITAIASVALGASVIEKHFTLDRSGGGPDDSFSLEPKEFTELCNGARAAWEAMGRVDYGRKSSETGNITFRRSLYVVEDVLEGEELNSSNIRSIRPGNGLAPKYYQDVIGAKASRKLVRGEPLLWDCLVVK